MVVDAASAGQKIAEREYGQLMGRGDPGQTNWWSSGKREVQAAMSAEMSPVPGDTASPEGDMGTYAAGPEHPGVLASRSEMAYSAGQAGDAAGARDQFAALLPVAERVLGPEHPDTLAARASLAYWTGQAGNAAAARDQFAALPPAAE